MRLLLAVILVLGFAAPAGAQEILGGRPTYDKGQPSRVPNLQATDRRIWAPGLDDGYVPQGLAMVEGALYLATYRSVDRDQNKGPCRVFRIDPDSGRETGQFDVPAPCGHAGGLAYPGGGRLYVVDSDALFRVDLATAFTDSPQIRTIRYGPGVKGHIAASSPGEVWLGSYERDREGCMLRFDAGLLDALGGGEVLKAERAKATHTIPRRAQGAAPDGKGGLWVTQSGKDWGHLLHLDLATGKVDRDVEVAGGIEGIDFDAQGRMWAVSEAGSRRWHGWKSFYPLLFRLDTAKLR